MVERAFTSKSYSVDYPVDEKREARDLDELECRGPYLGRPKKNVGGE
jgi:hypothetical protein